MEYSNPLHSYYFILVFGLILASILDFRTHKIPNELVFLLVTIGLSSQISSLGFNGLLTSLTGISIGFLLLPLYIGGGLGAGDVKLMAAAGSFMNPETALSALILSVLSAGLIGVGILVIKGGVLKYLSRYWAMFKILFLTGKKLYLPPQQNDIAAQQFPCAIAIAMGSIIALNLNWLEALI